MATAWQILHYHHSGVKIRPSCQLQFAYRFQCLFGFSHLAPHQLQQQAARSNFSTTVVIVQNLPGSCHKSLIYWTPIVHCVVVLYVYIRKKWVLPEQFHIFCQRLLIFSPNCSIIVQVTALIRKQLVTRNVHIPLQFGTF